MAIRKIVARSIGVDVITAEDLADNSITAAEITNGAVTADKLASNSVTTAKITDANVTTGKLATDLVVTHSLGSASTPSITFTGDTNTGIFSPAADTIAFTEGGVESMRIDSAGLVGIGCTPVSNLQINASSDVGVAMSNSSSVTSGNRGTISMFNSGTSTVGYIRFGAVTDNVGTDIQFANRPAGGSLTERMRIDSSGNVGIGTSSPTSGIKLDVVNSSASGTGAITTVRLNHPGTTAGDGPRLLFTAGASTTGGCAIAASGVALNSADMLFYAGGNTERMRINSSGSVGIGVTPDSNYFLTVQSTSDDNKNAVKLNQASTALRTQISFNNPNGQVGTIQTNGSATAYNTSSDYRLKENIAPMTGALAKVAQLKPVTYKWKVDGSDGEGFIAHELAEVKPDCVSGEKDAVDKDGNPEYQGVDTSFLVATLTAAIQELKAENDALKARLDAAGL